MVDAFSSTWGALVTETTQRELFGEGESATPSVAGLYADVVFDRPLDHAYTYAVPDSLRKAVAVGQRVQAPFGRRNNTTAVYCIGHSQTPPSRRVKELFSVVDDEAFLDPHLLRLTRWMADYYLCGWGQVLNAVVPAGVKDRAGTRMVAFV